MIRLLFTSLFNLFEFLKQINCDYWTINKTLLQINRNYKMESFMSATNESDRRIYQKIALISSLNDSIFLTSKYNPNNKSSKILSSLTIQDLINICKYSNPSIASIPQPVQQKIDNQKFASQKNSCLHVAAQFGNIHMVKHLVAHYKKINPFILQSQENIIKNQSNEKINERNGNLDTPLMHCLKSNSEHKMQKIVTYLAKYSDLTLRDKQNKLPFEVSLPAYSVSKVRILDYLKQKYQCSQ